MNKYQFVKNLHKKPPTELIKRLYNYKGSVKDFIIKNDSGFALALWALQYCGINDETIFTEDVCVFCVSKHGNAIKYFTNEQRTEKVCIAAVKENGYAIEYLFPHQRTENVCIAAVYEANGNLDLLNEKERTIKVIEAAEKAQKLWWELKLERRKYRKFDASLNPPKFDIFDDSYY
jgi:hypothetical protein